MQHQANHITLWRLFWFILGTIFGIFVMVVPLNLTYPDGTPTIDTITFFAIKLLMQAWGEPPFIITVLTCCIISTILACLDFFWQPRWIRKVSLLAKLAKVGPWDLAFRIIGTTIGILAYFQFGPHFLINQDTGQTMLAQATQLAILTAPILFLQTFILEFGFMEFLGTLIGFILRPLFKVSPLASVSLLSAWLIPGNAAVISSKQLYDEGYFTYKEAVIISSTFAISSIGWIVVVCTYLGLMDHFWTFFLTLTGVGMIMAAICVRIYPLNRYQDLYSNHTTTSPQAQAFFNAQSAPVVSKDGKEYYNSTWIKAFNLACKRCSELQPRNFIGKIENILSYIFNLSPVIICWGTLALCLVIYFPTFFHLISLPFAWLLEVLGIKTSLAEGSAPLILSSFADNYMPIALISTIENPTTQIKFIIGITSILQLIYLSEIGILLLQNKLIRNFVDLIWIFLQRTIICLVLTTLVTYWVF